MIGPSGSTLESLVEHVMDAVVLIDSCGIAFKQFKAGVGPYGEPQLVAGVADHLNGLSAYRGRVRVMRHPDILIAGSWAIEFKLARPFGDNGREAENWSVNLLHPYEGSVSLIGDCLRLARRDGAERKVAAVIGYEHSPSVIPLAPLFAAFEAVATQVAGIRLGARVQLARDGLCHPVHQRAVLAAWEVL